MNDQEKKAAEKLVRIILEMSDSDVAVMQIAVVNYKEFIQAVRTRIGFIEVII